MVFKKRDPETGELDPAINSKGRIAKEHKPTTKELRKRELLSLTRKLKPHLSKAVSVMVSTLNSEDSTESGKLKASGFMMKYYLELLNEVYDDGLIPEEELTDKNKRKAVAYSLVVSSDNIKNED